MKNTFKEGNMASKPDELALTDAQQPERAGTPAPVSFIRRLLSGFLSTMSDPLGDRNFRLLFSGQTISTLGDAFYLVALPWIILNNGGSAQELGVVLTFYGIPRVIAVVLGGFLSDWIGARGVMLLSDIARTLLIAILAVLVIEGHVSLFWLIVLVAGFGLFSGLFLPASYSIMPAILPRGQIQAANALNSASLQLATLVGYALAGIIVARVQPGVALAVDAVSFVASVVSLALMRTRLANAPDAPPQEAAAPAAQTEAEPLSFGRFLLTSRLFQITLLIITITFFASGGTLGVALPVFAHSVLVVGAGGYGVMLAVFAVGELVGGLVAGGLGKLPRRAFVILLLQIAQGLTFVALLVCGNLPSATVVLGLSGLLNGLINVMYFSIVQEFFPRHLMGRIWGVISLATFGLYPVSVAVGGIITQRSGPQEVFVAAGVLLILAALVGLSYREMRDLG
jgi:MFS family permease